MASRTTIEETGFAPEVAATLGTASLELLQGELGLQRAAGTMATVEATA